MYEITSEMNFSAAHHLLNYDGPCENVHGHNWLVRATVRCETLDKIGIGIDFKILKKALKATLDKLDHTDLNLIFNEEFGNPSSENIAYYIHGKIGEFLNDDRVKIYRVDVYETPGNCASYFND